MKKATAAIAAILALDVVAVVWLWNRPARTVAANGEQEIRIDHLADMKIIRDRDGLIHTRVANADNSVIARLVFTPVGAVELHVALGGMIERTHQDAEKMKQPQGPQGGPPPL